MKYYKTRIYKHVRQLRTQYRQDQRSKKEISHSFDKIYDNEETYEWGTKAIKHRAPSMYDDLVACDFYNNCYDSDDDDDEWSFYQRMLL